jgi:hypothetical protein
VYLHALSAGAYATTLLAMVDRVKGEGMHPPTLTRLGWFYHNNGIYARKRPLPLCVYFLLLCVSADGSWRAGERNVGEGVDSMLQSEESRNQLPLTIGILFTLGCFKIFRRLANKDI